MSAARHKGGRGSEAVGITQGLTIITMLEMGAQSLNLNLGFIGIAQHHLGVDTHITMTVKNNDI